MAEPSRLTRSLGLRDAVVIGLGAMIGAGVFAAIGPAAAAAGSGLLIGLAVAAVVAYCNATSSAQLAAVHPASGGTYVYGRERLGPVWGYLAGWGFVVGKTASCAAMALTFGSYAAPGLARLFGIGAVVAVTAVNYRGVRKTAMLTSVIVGLVLASLGVVVAASLLGGQADVSRLGVDEVPAPGILQAGGLLFFAFAGYARIATLGEEVSDPGRVIPRAIPVALGITLIVYAAVAVSALSAVGPEALAASDAPLAEAVAAGRWASAVWVVRTGATVASLGVLLSLLVGVSRTTFAMASHRELPGALAAVHPRFRTPHRAELAVAVVVCGVVTVADLRGAIGFSSFAVLVYYALTNASALRLGPHERRWPRGLAVLGLAGCLVLAFSLPATSVIGGVVVLLIGVAVRAVVAQDAVVELDRVLELFKALSQEGAEYVLVGATALNIHGIVRATEDVDVFVRPDAENVERVKRALRRVWPDPEIDQIKADDLAGDYPVIRYGPPGEDLVVDLISRLGSAVSFEDLEWELIDVDQVPVRVATAVALYRMKKATVRPIDRADAQSLKRAFDIEEE